MVVGVIRISLRCSRTCHSRPIRELDIVRLRNGSKKLVLASRRFAGISVSICDWLNFYTRSVIGQFPLEQSRNTLQS